MDAAAAGEVEVELDMPSFGDDDGAQSSSAPLLMVFFVLLTVRGVHAGIGAVRWRLECVCACVLPPQRAAGWLVCSWACAAVS